MNSRVLSAVTLAVVLCAIAGGAVLADGVVFYDDTRGDPDFEHDARKAGGSIVLNGAFDRWDPVTGLPEDWTVDTSGLTKAGHPAKMNLADPRHDANNALAMFVRTDGATAGGTAVAYSKLQNQDAGYYWVVVHTTAWGEYDSSIAHNSEAMYAISDKADPAAVPDSAWKELFPDSTVCENGGEICNHLARKETVYIPAGAYIYLKCMMKFPDLHAWTVFGWDDIAAWPVQAGEDWPYASQTWVDEGDITWDQFATR